MHKLVKVAANSNPSKVAGSIAGMVREGVEVSVQAIGLTASVRSICAIALATSFVQDQYKLLWTVKFVKVKTLEDQLLAYRFDLVRR